MSCGAVKYTDGRAFPSCRPLPLCPQSQALDEPGGAGNAPVGGSQHFLSAPTVHLVTVSTRAMLPGATYPFQLQATCLNGATGTVATASGAVAVSVNQPPRNGYVTVSPRTGVEATTEFQLLAAQWVDGDGDYPLTYRFAYSASSGSDGALLCVRSVWGGGLVRRAADIMARKGIRPNPFSPFPS